MKYPVKHLEKFSIDLQKRCSEYFASQSGLATFNMDYQERIQKLDEDSNNFMKEIRSIVLPKVNDVLSSIDAKLQEDTLEARQRISPILSKAKKLANDPTNPLGCRELSVSLTELKNVIIQTTKRKISYDKWGFVIGAVALFLFLLFTIIIPYFSDENISTGVVIDGSRDVTLKDVNITGFEKGIGITDSENIETINTTINLP